MAISQENIDLIIKLIPKHHIPFLKNMNKQQLFDLLNGKLKEFLLKNTSQIYDELQQI